MGKYRTCVRPDVLEPKPAPKSMKVDLCQLALNYGLSDMVNFSSGNSCDEQTVHDEFSAYMKGNFQIARIPDEDILVFWQVSIRTMNYHSRFGFTFYRPMKPCSPHYTQLHLTIYLSRHQQFHVNAFSLRVRRWTQSGTIEFIPPSWRPCKLLSSL